MDRKEVIDLYSKYASEFKDKIGSLKMYDESYLDFVARAKLKNSLLDLACGPGNVSAYIKGLLPDISITCVDLSQEMLDLAKDNIGVGTYYKTDILDIQIPKTKFDMIVCAFGLPYVQKQKVGKFISELDKFSKTDTSVYISSMQGKKEEKETMSFAGNEKLPVQRYQKSDIIEIFEDFNFLLSDYKELDYMERDGSITTDMIFNFRKC